MNALKLRLIFHLFSILISLDKFLEAWILQTLHEHALFAQCFLFDPPLFCRVFQVGEVGLKLLIWHHIFNFIGDTVVHYFTLVQVIDHASDFKDDNQTKGDNEECPWRELGKPLREVVIGWRE